MSEIDHEKFRALIRRLYEVVRDLEEMFPGRHFTPDGHMVGSIGEALVADAFELSLLPASNKGFDAHAVEDGRQVEIKATQGKSVAFRSCPQHAIVIRIDEDGSFETVYNGPGSPIWSSVSHKPPPKNGQYQISLSRLRKLNESVKDDLRLPEKP